MHVEIVEVKSRKQQKSFVNFPFDLYSGNPYWVPPLKRDEFALFDRSKNPALQHCIFKQWLAISEDTVVGRIAGIVHNEELQTHKSARFSWIDFIDEPQVVDRLIETVESWALEQGATQLHGPLGFSDMDPEGMLVDGFDSPATIVTIYNFQYYPTHLERLGYKKAVDWLEAYGKIPEQVPGRLARTAEIVEGRFKVRNLKLKNRKEVAKRGKELFQTLNECFKPLYGFHPLSEREINHYIKMYLGFVIPDLVSMVVNESDELVGFAVSMPSLTRAFQKARGSLLPLGLFHILKDLKTSKTVDLYLIGVLPEYQRMGVTALIFRDLIQAYNKRGFTTARTNIMLEENMPMLTQFNEYQDASKIHKRRRCFKKELAK